MQRIMIIGCPGAGKSTLSRALAEKLGVPLTHLDRLHWREGWQEVSKEEFDRLLAAEIEKPQWVIDGNYTRTIPMRLEKADTVVYLDFGRMRCTLGVLKRVITTHGRVRPDMGDGCPERFDAEFMQYVWNFNKNHRASLYEHIKDCSAEVIILKSRKEVKKFLENA